MQEEEFVDMEAYLLKKQNTVEEYIATRPILDLCKETVWMRGSKRYWTWQD